MSLEKTPGAMAFTGNPMIVRTAANANTRSVSVDAKRAGVSIGQFSFVPDAIGRVEFDVSDVLSSPDSYLIQPDVNEVIYPVTGLTQSYALDVTITDKLGSQQTLAASGTLFHGGISNAAFRELADRNLDYFSYRLNNHVRQFVFTTRTNGRNITMREREIYPMVFIHPGVSIAFVSDNGRMVIPPIQTEGTLCALNIERLRRMVYDTYKEVASYFSVLVDNSYIFDISITKSNAGEATVFMFRNSLGIYEKVEMSGNKSVSAEVSETKLAGSYNYTYGLPDVRPERKAMPLISTVNSGFKTTDEIGFVSDMLMSDDIFLIDNNKLIPVSVAVDKWTYDTSGTPVAVSITIKQTEASLRHTSILDYEAPTADIGEWIVQDGYINKYGFIYENYTL